MASGVTVSGVPELLESLRRLPDNLQKRVLRAWTMRKAREAAKAAQAAAPRGRTGNLRKGIAAKASGTAKLRRTGSLARAVVIGKKPAYHFHWVNMGISRSRQTETGANRGSMPANPFFQRSAQPILAQAQAEVGTDLAREVQRMLDAAIKRTVARGGR